MFPQNPRAEQIERDLAAHIVELKQKTLATLAQSDATRGEALTFSLQDISLDLSFTHLTPTTLDLLAQLGEALDIPAFRERMFCGEKINSTENRAVLHTALRAAPETAPILVDGQDILPEIAATKTRLRAFVEDVRAGRWLGATGQPIRDIVNIGIGGSDLGPRLACEALRDQATGPRAHFVANIDAAELRDVLASVDPATTLFLVVSKSFTTPETLENAKTARAWLVQVLGEAAVSRHFAAVSTNLDAVEAFGIAKANVFPMWDWVGGRYSLWSAVGLVVALAQGWEAFEELLSGAALMDAHTQTAPLAHNMPWLLAVTSWLYRQYWKTGSHAILPYAHRLRYLPDYLQQAEMESNGKSVTRDGQAVSCPTAPVIWGGCGTVFQHSFGQLLQQGTDIIPVDFIGVTQDPYSPPQHHEALLANMKAQAKALAFGHRDETNPARTNPGNRPSSNIWLNSLTPRALGLLLALYEHKIFYMGAIWNINSFDQFGVELGKKLARDEMTKTKG